METLINTNYRNAQLVSKVTIVHQLLWPHTLPINARQDSIALQEVLSELKIYVQSELTVSLARARVLNAVMPLLDSIKIKQALQAVKLVQLAMNVLKQQ